MKTRISFFLSMVLISAAFVISSCQQTKVGPTQALDDVFIPSGYIASGQLSDDMSSRLQEFQLDNPSDQYYYLKRESSTEANTGDWIFPQKELKIEFVEFDKSAGTSKEPQVVGVIVKKIEGKWTDEEYNYVDQKPSPVDGYGAFFHYVQQNLKYPAQAKQSGIEGKVFIEFLISENGQLTNVKSIKGIGAGCDEEAVRVIKEAPNWNPGLMDGKPAKVKMILPITYKLG